MGLLEQGMNSPDENKLHFTKNWQIENEHVVILVPRSAGSIVALINKKFLKNDN